MGKKSVISKKKKSAGRSQELVTESNLVASVADQILEASQMLYQVVEEAPHAHATKEKSGENSSSSPRFDEENQEKVEAKAGDVVNEVLKDLQQEKEDADEGDNFQSPPTSVKLQQDKAEEGDSDRTLSTIREKEHENLSEDEHSQQQELKSKKAREFGADFGKQDDDVLEENNEDENLPNGENSERQESKGKKLHSCIEDDDEEEGKPENKKRRMKPRRFLDSAAKENFDFMTKIGLIHEATVSMNENRFPGILDVLKKARME